MVSFQPKKLFVFVQTYPSLDQYHWSCTSHPIPECGCILIKQNKLYFFYQITYSTTTLLHQQISKLLNNQTININFQIYNLSFNYIKSSLLYQQSSLPTEKILQMNKQQAVKQHLRSVSYIESNKLRPFFHDITKLLLLKQPQDPIQFLIDFLQKRNKRQIICIQGYDQPSRIRIAKNVANKFNFKNIQLTKLFKHVADWNSLTDVEINNQVLKEINKVQTVYKGIIISGYPNNLVQTNFIQKSGILPQRYFMLNNNQREIKKSYQQKYDGNVDKLLERNNLEIKQLTETLGQLIDNLPIDIQKAQQKIIQTIGLKANKKTIPTDSPRILVLYPPYLQPQHSEILSSLFSLNKITVNSTFKKLSQKQNFIKHVQSYVRKHNTISKQIQLAMIETETKNAISKNKGFALYGWPQRKDRLALLKEHYLNPHLIFIFQDKKQKALNKFDAVDPNNAQIFAVTKKPTRQQYSKLYDEFQQTVDQLRGKNNVQILPFQQTAQKIIKTFTSLMQNPKIYS